MSHQTTVPISTGSGDTKGTGRGQREDEGSDCPDSKAISPADQHATRKKPPRQFIYAFDPEAYVADMCPINKNQLWVLYSPKPRHKHKLELLDAEGQTLMSNTVEPKLSYLFPVDDSILVVWQSAKKTEVQLIKLDGSITFHELELKIEELVSSATNEYQYLKRRDDGKLYRLKFRFAENGQTGRPRLHLGASPSESLIKPELTFEEEIVVDETPRGRLKHVSAGGDYFAFFSSSYDIYGNHKWTVTVYTLCNRSFNAVYSYSEEHIAGIRFWNVGKKDLLVVVLWKKNKIDVISFTEKGCPVRQLTTAPVKLQSPLLLAIGCDQQLYIGCDGGKIVVIYP